MITIKQPFIESDCEHSRLAAEIIVNGNTTTLWFEVENRYKDFLCSERSDAFVLGLLHYAMRYNHEIRCEAPMTSQLHFQIANNLLSILYKFNKNSGPNAVYPIQIQARLEDASLWSTSKTAVGAGLSCGVDSLHVFSRFLNSDHKWLNISHACVFKLHGDNLGDSQEKLDSIFADLVKRATMFAADAGVDLIVGNTNFDRGAISDLKYDGSSTYANLFCIFCLQKLFRVYHFASGYDMNSFYYDKGIAQDPAHYDPLTAAAVSINGFSIYLDGLAQNRLDKVRDLGDFPLSYTFLNVCHTYVGNHDNCSYKCPKCMRTMLELYLCNSLDAYTKVFDVNYFSRNFHQYLAEYYRGILQKDSFCMEMRDEFKKLNIPLSSRIRAAIIVARKALCKIFRLGKKSQLFQAE